jgi:hypothetical protein
MAVILIEGVKIPTKGSGDAIINSIDPVNKQLVGQISTGTVCQWCSTTGNYLGDNKLVELFKPELDIESSAFKDIVETLKAICN